MTHLESLHCQRCGMAITATIEVGELKKGAVLHCSHEGSIRNKQFSASRIMKESDGYQQSPMR